MKYRQLGLSELYVSEVAFGTWLTLGVGVDNATAAKCVNQAFDDGINFFDTANVYGHGAAELALGKLLQQHRRDSFVLATKLYFPMSDEDRGLSRVQIHKQIDASLKRLRVDHVDLYQCHRYDTETPLEETLSALTEVVNAGKARYVGFSEWSPSEIQAALDTQGYSSFVSSQPQYSMLWRHAEQKVIPMCSKAGISQIVWSPLAQGVLTGKYLPNNPPPKDSRSANEAMNGFMDRFRDNDLLQRVQDLKPVAQELDISMAQLALAWVLREENVASAIIGASRPEQITDNAKASGLTLDANTLAMIDQILAPILE